MKFRILIAAAGLGVALVAGATQAGEKADPAKDHAPKQQQLAQSERRVDYTLEGLTHAMDLWHDAVLKGDDALAARYEVLIDNILTEDITATEMACKRLDNKSGSDQMKHAKAECKQETDRIRVLIKEKKELARQVRANAGFTEKYRRLGIYINLLRRELGMPKAKFADASVPKK